MATVKVAINGFGRIGRLAFRQMFGAKGYKIVAINDLTSPKMLAHLLKYDTTQGNYANSHTVTYKDAVLAEDGKTVVTPGSITVDGTEITIYACAKAQDLPWKKLKVDVLDKNDYEYLVSADADNRRELLKELVKNNIDVMLTALEYKILLTLALNPNVVFTREKILADIWDVNEEYVNDNTLTVYIKRIREKIEDNPTAPRIIETVRGVGYKIGVYNEK